MEVFDPGAAVRQTLGDEAGPRTCFSSGDVGNVFEVLTTTQLAKIEVYLTGLWGPPSPDMDLYYFVYEGLSVPGSFNKVFQEYVSDVGSGSRWYSSGWIDVTLRAGRYYYVGASWNTYTCIPQSAESGPIATAFGAFLRNQDHSATGAPDYFTPRDTSSTIWDAAGRSLGNDHLHRRLEPPQRNLPAARA